MGGCQINFTVSFFPMACFGRWQDKSNEVVMSTLICSVNDSECNVNLQWWRLQKTKWYCIFTTCDQVVILTELRFLSYGEVNQWEGLLLKHSCTLVGEGAQACSCIRLHVCLEEGAVWAWSGFCFWLVLISLWWRTSDLLLPSRLIRWV